MPAGHELVCAVNAKNVSTFLPPSNLANRKETIMPVVIVEMWEGRTIEQKKQLVESIASAFVKIGTPSEAVHIIIKDNPKHNWASGGRLASEQS